MNTKTSVITAIVGLIALALVLVFFGSNLIGSWVDRDEGSELPSESRVQSMEYTVEAFNRLPLNKLGEKSELIKDLRCMSLVTDPIVSSHSQDSVLTFEVDIMDRFVIRGIENFEVVILNGDQTETNTVIFEEQYPIKDYLKSQLNYTTTPRIVIKANNDQFSVGEYYMIYGYTDSKNTSKLFYQMARVRITN